MADNLKAALYYQKQGFSLIPVNAQKKPLIKWEEFQKRIAPPEEIESWFQKYPKANIGIVTGEISNLTVIDIDTEEGRKALNEILPDSFISPIADTPSGGSHYYCKYAEGTTNAVRFIEGCDIRSEGGYIVAPPSKNGDKAWRWREGAEIHKVPLSDVPASLKDIIMHSLYMGKLPDSKTGSILVNNSKEMFILGRRDEDLFHVSNCLTKGGMPAAEIFQVLEKLIISWGENPDRKWIEAKIESALKRDSNRFESMAEGVRDFVSVNSGKFSVKDVEIWVNSSKLQSNKPVLMELGKLVKDEKIERLQQHGHYRIIETDFDAVSFDDIDIGERLQVRLPFGLERYIEIMPKDLIVFAGVPNVGKSAIMMEVAGLNQSLADCWYFSSEMGRVNWKKRLSKYEGNTKWKYKFADDFPNFIDVIKPDAFNFIDYVEVADGEFYKIPSILSSIQKRLKNGLAFVALQKNPDKEYGVGGQQTLAKPALFCTIDPDYPHGAVMRVKKAKNYMDINPNGFMMKFKIINGINLRPNGTWMPEMGEK